MLWSVQHLTSSALAPYPTCPPSTASDALHTSAIMPQPALSLTREVGQQFSLATLLLRRPGGFICQRNGPYMSLYMPSSMTVSMVVMPFWLRGSTISPMTSFVHYRQQSMIPNPAKYQLSNPSTHQSMSTQSSLSSTTTVAPPAMPGFEPRWSTRITQMTRDRIRQATNETLHLGRTRLEPGGPDS